MMKKPAYQPDADTCAMASQMIFDRVPTRTIEFFMQVYPHIRSGEVISCADMAGYYKVTPQAAIKHIRVLESLSYLGRVHYRGWQFLSRDAAPKSETALDLERMLLG